MRACEPQFATNVPDGLMMVKRSIRWPVHLEDAVVLPLRREGLPHQPVDVRALRLGDHVVVLKAKVAQAFAVRDIAVDGEIYLGSSPQGVLSGNNGDRVSPKTLGVIVDRGVEVIDGERDMKAAHPR
jgi:hypothetical protein